jgi:hypothetical protein
MLYPIERCLELGFGRWAHRRSMLIHKRTEGCSEDINDWEVPGAMPDNTPGSSAGAGSLSSVSVKGTKAMSGRSVYGSDKTG